jgi:hypothetical protein
VKISPGVLALVIGSAAAVVGLGVYQAWWTVAFPIGGAIAATLEHRGIRAIETTVVGVVGAVCLALGGLGAFLVVMGGRSCARPDLPCPSGPPDTLLLGAGLLAGSIVVLAVLVVLVRRRLRVAARNGDPHDIRR